MTSRETIHEFLRLLAGDENPDHFLDLRWRFGHGQLLKRRFFRLDDAPAAAAAIAARGARSDTYVGCAPRRPAADGRPAGGGRDAIERVWTLWVECDTSSSTRALRALPLAPSALIRSGTGDNAHAYFALTEPIDANAAEDANRRLAAAVGGDPVCYDAARILRPPETRNYKRKPSRPVVAEWIEPDRRRPLASWLEHAPQLPRASRTDAIADPRPARDSRLRRGGRTRAGSDALLAITPAIYVRELLRLREIPRDRKVTCPFHTDERPSLHVYPTAERGWFCFSCRRGGTIYDLAAAIGGYRTNGREFIALRNELERRFASHLARTEACA